MKLSDFLPNRSDRHVSKMRKKRIKRFVKQMDADRKKRQQREVAPPGKEDVVKALKGKYDDPSVPYKIAWSQYNKEKKESKLAEYGTALDLAYDPISYENPVDAVNEFIRLNKEVSKNKTTDMQTIKSFLKNVYQQSGDHNVSLASFLKQLVKKKIKITNGKNRKFSDLKYGENG